MDINLLPRELKPKRLVSNVAKTLRKIALVSLTVVLVGGIFSIVTIIFFSQRVKSSVAGQQKLIQQIVNLEKTEQQLILVRDRIQKVNAVFSAGSAREEVDILEEISQNLPAGANLSEIDVQSDSLGVSVNAASLIDVITVMRKITGGQNFSFVEMDSLSFSPKTGYSLSFNIKKK